MNTTKKLEVNSGVLEGLTAPVISNSPIIRMLYTLKYVSFSRSGILKWRKAICKKGIIKINA